MESYLKSIGQQSQLDAEWQIYKNKSLKYEERNYMDELEAFELAENKLSPYKRSDADVLDNVRTRMFHSKCRKCHCSKPKFLCECERDWTVEEIKQRVYMEWLSYKYKQFRKNWKSMEDEGLNFMWLTFNFSPNIEICQFKMEMARIVNLSIFKQTKLTYSYEFYTDNGGHPHCHMLVELKRTGTIKPSDLKEHIFRVNGLEDILKLTYEYSWAKGKQIDKRCPNRAFCEAYVKGLKKEEKQENCEKDKLWRTENEIEQIYIKEF